MEGCLFLLFAASLVTVPEFFARRQRLNGGVAEWLKAAVLKTVERKFRGFESYLLRQLFSTEDRQDSKRSEQIYDVRRGDREADGARLLSECSVCYRGFESLPLRQ